MKLTTSLIGRELRTAYEHKVILCAAFGAGGYTYFAGRPIGQDGDETPGVWDEGGGHEGGANIVGFALRTFYIGLSGGGDVVDVFETQEEAAELAERIGGSVMRVVEAADE